MPQARKKAPSPPPPPPPPPPPAPKKKPQRVDVLVGSRIRMRRMELGLSQEHLGKSIGLTFQQVQKYEKGANRVGGSRLVQIADVLGVPPAFFFQEVGSPAVLANDDDMSAVMAFTSSSDGIRLSKAFMRLKRSTRLALVKVVQSFAGETEDDAISTAHH